MKEEEVNGTSIRRRQFHRVRRVVVKVGSGVIAAKGRLRPGTIGDLTYDVTVLRHQGYEVLLVVSGAVAAGFSALGLSRPPTEVVERQAAACVGQYQLMTVFASAFKKHRARVAQLLMMAEDIDDRRRFLSARHTLHTLIARDIVPIINENDPLADDEQKIGDNDHLAALVTNLASADLLVILSSVPGVYRNGSNSEIIPTVAAGSTIDEHISTAVSESGVGGMVAKVSAARLASRGGVPTIIADGKTPGLLPRILAGEKIGTIFLPVVDRIPSRKRWIAMRTRSYGAVRVEARAQRAIIERGASLLPAGVVGVDGRFTMGARVDIQDDAGATFAVGLASYSSREIALIQGKHRADFKHILGYRYVNEIVHRDDMVLLRETDGNGGKE